MHERDSVLTTTAERKTKMDMLACGTFAGHLLQLLVALVIAVLHVILSAFGLA